MNISEYLALTEGEAFHPDSIRWEDAGSASSFGELAAILQYRWFRAVIDNAGVSGKHLDAACGTGYGTDYLARSPNVVHSIGVDLNDRHLEVARQNFPDREFVKHDVEHLGAHFNTNSFAFVTSGQTIEHLLDPVSFVRGIAAIMRDDGVFALMTPTHDEDPVGLKPSNPWHVFEFNPPFMRRLLCFFFDTVHMGNDLPYRETFAPLSNRGTIRIPIANATWCARPIRSHSPDQIERFRIEYLCGMYSEVISQAQRRAVEARRNNSFLSKSYHLIDFVEGFYAPEIAQIWMKPEATFKITTNSRPVRIEFSTGRAVRDFAVGWDDKVQRFSGQARAAIVIDKEESAIVSVKADPFLPGGSDIRTLGVAICKVQEL